MPQLAGLLDRYQRAVFKNHWSNESIYSMIVKHNFLRSKSKTEGIDEVNAAELEVLEEVLTERGIWFPKDNQ